MPPYQIQTPDGRQAGPLDFNQLRQAVQQGHLPPQTLVTDTATGEQLPLTSIPDFAHIVAAQGAAQAAGAGPRFPPPQESPLVSSGLIPVHNKPALISYYLGLFSLIACIPFLGVIGIGMAVAALILGLRGMKLAHERPQVKGTAHAWIGILGGIICGLAGLLINILVIIAILEDSM